MQKGKSLDEFNSFVNYNECDRNDKFLSTWKKWKVLIWTVKGKKLTCSIASLTTQIDSNLDTVLQLYKCNDH